VSLFVRWASCWYLIRADAHRVNGRTGAGAVLHAAWTHPPFRFQVVHRVGTWARSGRGHRPSRLLTAALYRRYSRRCAIEIPFAVRIGPGMLISHAVGGVVVNDAARLGSAVTLAPGVILGNDAPDKAAPTLGDLVSVNVGAKLIGGIKVGDRVQVGANAVVVRDLPSDCVAAGVPARVLEGHEPHLARAVDPATVLGPLPDDLPGD
jgi:serine O-acetyltransferase